MVLSGDQGSSPEMDVDALLEQVNAPEQERPMSGPETSEQTAAPEAAEAAAPTPVQEFEYEFSGRKIKEPIDMILKRAGMGYDYAQKMEAFKREQANYKAQLEEKYKPYDKYKQIDEYVQKDPDWWNHVEQSWQDRLSNEDPTVKRVKSILDEELRPVKELLTQKEQEAQQAKIAEEDNVLEQDIKSIRSEYKDLDFDTPDAEGKSLEDKVLEYGAKFNFPTFKAAFRDFYHDQLRTMYESRGREAIGKEAVKRQKLGLSGTPQTPKQKPTDGYDVRGKSMNQILQEVLEREGIT